MFFWNEIFQKMIRWWFQAFDPIWLAHIFQLGGSTTKRDDLYVLLGFGNKGEISIPHK